MSWFQDTNYTQKTQTALSFPGEVLGGIGSYVSAINPFNSLNAFRLTGDFRYNETRLEQMSPAHKEVMINSYNGTLGIPKPDTFQVHVETYLTTQDEALAEKVVDKTLLSPEQQETYDKLKLQSSKENLSTEQLETYNELKLEALEKVLSPNQLKTYKQLETKKTALRNELKAFTAQLEKLPSNTHADTLAALSQEKLGGAVLGVAEVERDTLIKHLKRLNQQTEAFTKSLEKDNPSNTTNTASTTTPGASTGAGITAGAGRTGVGVGGVGATTGASDTIVDTGTSTGTTTTNIPSPDGTTTAPPIPMTEADAKNLGKNLDALSAQLNTPPSTPDLDELEKQLTGTITDMHRAAQLERDRIPLLATLTANKRKQQLFTSTISKLRHPTKLFGEHKAKPPSVLFTGDDQAGVENLREAMRLLDRPNQAQTALNEAEENLEKTETRLKKANDDNDQDKIDQYKKEKKEYEATIETLKKQTAPDLAKARDLMNGASGWELFGYNPGLTALSGKKITVTADGQGLGFHMDFPRPIFDPGYYTSAQHNTKADLVCMAELVKATGAKTVTATITCHNPKMAQRLAQEAFEAALEVGFDEEKITVLMNGQKMTKETLYQHLDKQTGKETGKYRAKQQRADSLKNIASQGRDAAKSTHKTEIEKQQASLKNALQDGRDELDAAFKNDANTPDASPTSIVSPSS
ncbi:MAG: hypothetical protein P1U36_05750 [Legionellaceae bacterium]|nr:hypothetical protein [Legionellaceae bacterium]